MHSASYGWGALTRETKLYAAGGRLEQIMAKDQEKEREKQKQKQSSDGDEEHDYSGKCVTFLNIFSFVAGVAMAAVGGMIIYRAIDNGIAMSIDKWISTIYSILMGILVIASSGAHSSAL